MTNLKRTNARFCFFCSWAFENLDFFDLLESIAQDEPAHAPLSSILGVFNTKEYTGGYGAHIY